MFVATETTPNVGRSSGRRAEGHSVIDFLEQMAWYQMLYAEAQARVAADVYETYHAKGELVAQSGEYVHSWMGVIEGLVKIQAVQRDGKVVGFTGVPAGSWFGEGSVIRQDVRRYEVAAMRSSRILHLPRTTFRWLLDVSLDFNHYIIDHLNERLAQHMSLVEIDRVLDSDMRLARVIGNLFNPVLYPKLGPFIPLSQEEFGDLAGLSRQRTNSAIKSLEKAGVLRITYGGVHIEDIDGLRRYIRGD